MLLRAKGFLLFLTVMAGGLLGAPAQAGVFSTPHFVEPEHFALGLEPELVLSQGAGIGVNARYTHGLTDLMDVQGIVGTGSGPRRFRLGGNLGFDFIPDASGQPGLGLATQMLYVRVPDGGRLELTAIPYIHKAFPVGGEGDEVEPFFAFPLGFAFTGGNYQGITQAVVGALFKKSESIRLATEIGINVNHSETYISGGLVFSH